MGGFHHSDRSSLQHFPRKSYCAARESNPGRKNGNLAWYHYTSGAYSSEIRMAEPETFFPYKANAIIWFGDVGDWTRDLSHAKRTLYHWATSPPIYSRKSNYFLSNFTPIWDLRASTDPLKLCHNMPYMVGFSVYCEDMYFSLCMMWARQFSLKTYAPNVGLEPTTLGLRVPCSTDWANRAYFY